MAGIADFLDSLIGGFALMCYALTLGSLFWGLCILRPWQTARYPVALLNRSVDLFVTGAYWLAGAQLFKVLLKIWLMTAVLERFPFPEFAQTTQFIGGVIRAVLTLCLAVYVQFVLRTQACSKKYWLIALAVAIPMVVSGAWLVHGAGRFEQQGLLMTLTVSHQVAAAAWIGGVFHLVNVWLMRQREQIPAQVWTQALRDFSPFAMGAVALLLLSGVPIALQYIDSWNGLIGTGYGNLLSVKVILLGIALGFAALNRHASLRNNAYSLTQRVPYYVEAETFVLITLLFTAASLASQPPAIDIPNLTASWQEVIGLFAPQIPRIDSPSHSALLAGEAGRVAIINQVPSIAATEWSNYNHNIAGIFLSAMSLAAMLSYKLPAFRYWPLGFVGLGIFLFFRSDAETWPLGPIGFWESTFNNGEVLQHRIATLLVFVLGLLELSARLTQNENSKLPFFFPVLAAFGGLMLLTHSHVGFQPKSAFLIQVGHTLMGVFALVLAVGRWLELKLDEPNRSIAGFISVVAMLQIGMILMFYREPLY